MVKSGDCKNTRTTAVCLYIYHHYAASYLQCIGAFLLCVRVAGASLCGISATTVHDVVDAHATAVKLVWELRILSSSCRKG